MTLPYNDELKKMITGVLEEGIDGRSLFYQPPEKIYFEGNEYLPRQFLAEVKKRSQVGERVLRYIHNQTSTGLEKQLQGVENPDEPFFGFINPDGSETNHSISDIVTGLENQTEFGKEYLLATLKLNVPEMFGFAYREIKNG